MIVLPEKAERLNMAGFLISSGILATTAACLVFWFINGQFLYIALLGVVCNIVLVMIETIWQNTLVPLYTGWNRMAKKYALFLHHWVSISSFYLIMSAVGRFGKKDPFRQEEPKMSNWYPKTSHEKDTYASQSIGSANHTNHKSSWVGSFISSNMLKKNKWMIFLLPHLLLLRISKVKSDTKSQDDIYTLY